jgi:hypothetical protein
MSVPAGEYDRLLLCPLPDYEPDEPGAPPTRWSSLRPPSRPQLTLVPPPAEPGRPPVPPAALVRVLRHVLEVLDGRRPIGQLHSLLPDVAFESLLTRLRSVRPGTRHRLHTLRAYYPVPTAVEVCAVIEVHTPERERMIAAAARFEDDGDRWACTVLRLL